MTAETCRLFLARSSFFGPGSEGVKSCWYKSKRRPLACAALLPIPPVKPDQFVDVRVGFQAPLCQAPRIDAGPAKAPASDFRPQIIYCKAWCFSQSVAIARQPFGKSQPA